MLTPGFGSSQPRFSDEHKKKTSAVRRATGNKGKIKKDKWAGAALYVRSKPWDAATQPPKNALILVEKIIPGEEGDDDEMEYETFFYNKKGHLIKRLNATISLDNNNDFKVRDYAHVKKILLGKEKGYERNAQGAVPTALPGNLEASIDIIHDLIAIARDRAKIKKRDTYGCRGGVIVGLGGLVFGIVAATGTVVVPGWVSIISLVSGGYALGKAALGLYFDNKNKCFHKTKSALCPSSECCDGKDDNQLEAPAFRRQSDSLAIRTETKQKSEQEALSQRLSLVKATSIPVHTSEVRLEIGSCAPDSASSLMITKQPLVPTARSNTMMSMASSPQQTARSPSPDLLAPKRRVVPVATPARALYNSNNGLSTASAPPPSAAAARGKRAGSLKNGHS